MKERLRSLFSTLNFEDEDKNRLAALFTIALSVTFAVAILTSIGFIIFVPVQRDRLAVIIFIIPLILFMLYMVRRGYVYQAIKIYIVFLWFILASLVVLLGGLYTPAFTSFLIVIVMAGLLWSGRAALFFAIITILYGFIIAVADQLNLIAPLLTPPSPLGTWVGQTANFLLISIFLYQTRESLDKALTKAREEVATRLKAETALRQGETQLRHVLDSVPESVLLLNNDGRINLANPAAEHHLSVLAPQRERGVIKMLGDHSLQELLTSPPKGLWHEITAGGAIFEAIARPVESAFQEQGWVMVIRDVTKERQIQRQIRQQERLAAVGQLAAGIAHDFNNIIAVIVLYAQMLAHQSQATPYMKEKLLTIQQQGQRAADLIQQILDFSRQSVLDQRPLEVIPFLKEMVNLFGRTLRENIDIQLLYQDGSYTIFVDPSRIQQVLLNLAVNARDAMPSGGRLIILLDQIKVKDKESAPMPGMASGSWVSIQIADTGSGIPPETVSRIFEPFFSTKEVGKGTGLGLAQVYGIMKQHSGYLDVTSEVGKGTIFTLYFPAYSEDRPVSVRSENQELPYGQGQTILLVEDNFATRSVLVDSLQTLNYQVIEAHNGREALKILSQPPGKIDVILSDAVMPEMGGVALLRALAEAKIDLPMIILTGHPLTGELDSLRAIGLDGWILKPPTLEALAKMLDKVLKK